ncbi:hypothetical protein [Tamilnaduibacter salinus]|uniref:hypothetical protein n=1 Tax=Tamilnaduibacter salinus TaxID=1484056 RepID=UPI002ADF4C4F|nr:hypothetical protein [Tamilnaduibacter salinus]
MFGRFLKLPRLHKRVISVASDGFFLTLALWASFALRLEQAFLVAQSRAGPSF